GASVDGQTAATGEAAPVRKALDAPRAAAPRAPVRTLSSMTPPSGTPSARVDHARPLRTGEPEVVYAAGKTPAQVAAVMRDLLAAGAVPVLATRATAAHAAALPDAAFAPESGLLVARAAPRDPTAGTVAVVCAGTSDLP